MSALGGFFILSDTLTPVLEEVDIELLAEGVLEDLAGDVESYAKANAPWNDVTGNARAGLTADVFRDDATVVLQLYHTVDYGVWLETIQAGEYAIIMPTLEHFAHEAFERCHAEETSGEEGEF